MDAQFATFDRRDERGGYLPSASVRISFSESTAAGDGTLTCQMRGAGDDHSSAQQGVDGGRHSGPLSILLKHRNRNTALFN